MKNFFSVSYKGRLLLVFSLLFLLFAFILTAFIYEHEQQQRMEVIKTKLRGYADMVALHLQRQPRQEQQKIYEELHTWLPKEVRITVIDPQGSVYYESVQGTPAHMENHHARKEVQEALQKKEGSEVRLSTTTGLKTYYLTRSYETFLVRVAVPYETEVQQVLASNRLSLGFLLLVFPLSLLVLLFFTHRLDKAIRGLRRFVVAAERGLVDYERWKFPRSELGDLATRIQTRYEEIDRSRREVIVERERLLRHFLHLESGIAIFNSARQVLYANPRFLPYMNALTAATSNDVATLWQAPAFQNAVAFLQAGKDSLWRETITAASRDYALQVLRYEDGGFEIMLSDVTEAEQSKRLKWQISHNLTHELRTPVSSIAGYLETLRTTPQLTPAQHQHFLDRAFAQTQRLAELLRDVGLLLRMEEGRASLPCEPVSLRQVVAEVAEELLGERAASVVDNRLPATLIVEGSFSLLYSIFRNLMENSLRYAGTAAQWVVTCYEQEHTFCYLSYYDTGVGVPEASLPYLFERFFRVDDGRTRDLGGSGLGLSIVRNAVLFHNGQISARNRPEGGLEFLFSLRLRREQKGSGN